MTTHLPSIALTTAGAYLAYSGTREKSKCLQMAKVAAGVALLAGGIAYCPSEWIDRKVFRIAKQNLDNGDPGLGTILLRYLFARGQRYKDGVQIAKHLILDEHSRLGYALFASLFPYGHGTKEAIQIAQEYASAGVINGISLFDDLIKNGYGKEEAIQSAKFLIARNAFYTGIQTFKMLLEHGLGREEAREAAQCLIAIVAECDGNELMSLLEPGAGLTEKVSGLLSSTYTKEQAERILKEWGALPIFPRPRFDATKCDLKRLDDIAFLHGNKAGLGKLIHLVNSTVGLNCGNYHPWPTGALVPDYPSIKPGNLSSPVEWFIDPARRFGVAIRHKCDNGEEGVVVPFQRYTNMFERPRNNEGISFALHNSECRFPLGSWHYERDIQKLNDLLTTGVHGDVRLA